MVIAPLFISLGENPQETEKTADQQRDQQADGRRDTINYEGGFNCVCHIIYN
jgi:hypothetical protein